MWIYINKDGIKIAIPYSNIDSVFVSKGFQIFPNESFYHKKIRDYCNSEIITVIYKKSGGFVHIKGEEAFDQLAATPEHKFVCDKV